MRYFKVLSYLSVILILFNACSSSDGEHEYEEFIDLDFGDGVYRPNPFPFLDNLPPFSLMGMPDSVKNETELEVLFNEDAIRNKSRGFLTFVDENGHLVNGISINGILIDPYENQGAIIDATADSVIVSVQYTVDPAVGDSLLHGVIIASGENLDMVNYFELEQDFTPIANWQLKHEIGINWLRWLILILIVVIVLYIIYELCLLLAYIITSLKAFLYRRKKWNPDDDKNNKRKKRKKRKNRCVSLELLRRYIIFVYALSDYYLVRYKILSVIRNIEDSQIFSPKLHFALEKLRNEKYPYDMKGRWTGQKGNSRFVPHPDVVLSDGTTYKEFCKKIGVNYKRGVRYRYGEPDFKRAGFVIKQAKVGIRYFYENGSRSSIWRVQEKAMEKMGLERNPYGAFSFKDNNNLVPHEKRDMRTVQLVHKPIHDLFRHGGGVMMRDALYGYLNFFE